MKRRALRVAYVLWAVPALIVMGCIFLAGLALVAIADWVER